MPWQELEAEWIALWHEFRDINTYIHTAASGLFSNLNHVSGRLKIGIMLHVTKHLACYPGSIVQEIKRRRDATSTNNHAYSRLLSSGPGDPLGKSEAPDFLGPAGRARRGNTRGAGCRHISRCSVPDRAYELTPTPFSESSP